MGFVHFVKNKQDCRDALLNGELPTWVKNSKRQSYIIKIILSAPPWVERKTLIALNREAARITAETGVLHVLDHEIPVNHPRVCGLTVPWNLKIVPWGVNASKSNKWCPEQQELF